MKGITHFASGAAIATFFPSAVDMALNEHSFIILLGGVFGILPDTLDFKLGRFMHKYDYEVDPDHKNPDPQQIADITAKAINEAFETGKMVTTKYHTIKLGSDLFRQYSLQFDNENHEVIVEIGPLVTMSKIPFGGSEPKENKIGRAKLNCNVFQDHKGPTYIDIFGGPDFGFIKTKENEVEACFIPWHREWSHSITLGVIFGILGWLFLGPIYGLVISLAFLFHILEDQLGFMGSNLFWPITKGRNRGLHLIRANNALGNFGFVWISGVLIIYNLNRFRPQPLFHISFIKYILYTFIIPMAIIYLIGKAYKKWEERPAPVTYGMIKADEAHSEMGEEFKS